MMRPPVLWRCCGAARALQSVTCCKSVALSSCVHPNQDRNNINLTGREEALTVQIKHYLLKARMGSVEDLVQSLAVYCSQIHLTSRIVDGLMFKFGDDWKSALGFFLWAQSKDNYKHTTYACNKMVDLLGKMRQIDRMWDLLFDMHCRGLVTVETVAKSFRRLAGARRWKSVVVLFDKLEDIGLERNTKTMNILLDALCKEKKVDIARQVFLELKQHIQPDAYTFNIFVHGWCNVRKIDEAMWTIEEMKAHGCPPSVITYTTILEAYCKQTNFRKVYEVLDSMGLQGYHPNAITYTMVMTYLSKHKMFGEALGVSNMMKSSGCKPDTLFYNSLIILLGKAGHLAEASQVFQVEMPMNGVPRSLATYNTMISIFCWYDQDEDALNVLKEMEAQSCKPDLQTYQPLLTLFLRRGQGDTVRKILNELSNKHRLGLDVDTYSLLIHGLCRIGDTDLAYQMFYEMVGSEIVPKNRRTWELLLSEAQRKNMVGHVERIQNYMASFGISL